MSQRNHYNVLKVAQNASQEEIRKAYLRLVRENHPDANPSASQTFQEINEAYRVLSDPAKRASYDELTSGAYYQSLLATGRKEKTEEAHGRNRQTWLAIMEENQRWKTQARRKVFAGVVVALVGWVIVSSYYGVDSFVFAFALFAAWFGGEIIGRYHRELALRQRRESRAARRERWRSITSPSGDKSVQPGTKVVFMDCPHHPWGCETTISDARLEFRPLTPEESPDSSWVADPAED